MVFFNDPLPCPDAPERAVRMARGDARAGRRAGGGRGSRHGPRPRVRRRASRRATPRSAAIGFEGRFDYAAIGTVTNLAARLCDAAAAGQILVSPRVQHAAEGIAVTDPLGELALRGFARPARVFNVVRLEEREPAGA